MIVEAEQWIPAQDVRPGWTVRHRSAAWTVESVALTSDGVDLALVPQGRPQRASHLKVADTEIITRLAPPHILDEFEAQIVLALAGKDPLDLSVSVVGSALVFGANGEEWFVPLRQTYTTPSAPQDSSE